MAARGQPLIFLQILLHFLNVGLLGLQQLVCQIPHPLVLQLTVPDGTDALGHAHGGALDHHLRDLGGGVIGHGLHGAHHLGAHLRHGADALGLDLPLPQHFCGRVLQLAVLRHLGVKGGQQLGLVGVLHHRQNNNPD